MKSSEDVESSLIDSKRELETSRVTPLATSGYVSLQSINCAGESRVAGEGALRQGAVLHAVSALPRGSQEQVLPRAGRSLPLVHNLCSRRLDSPIPKQAEYIDMQISVYRSDPDVSLYQSYELSLIVPQCIILVEHSDATYHRHTGVATVCTQTSICGARQVFRVLRGPAAEVCGRAARKCSGQRVPGVPIGRIARPGGEHGLHPICTAERERVIRVGRQDSSAEGGCGPAENAG